MRQTRAFLGCRVFSAGLLFLTLLVIFTALAPVHAFAHPAINAKKMPGVSVSPHAANPGTSIVAIHGINAGDGSGRSAVYGASNMPGCASYWPDAHNYLSGRWTGDFRQLAYYTNEYDSNGNPC